LKCICIYNWVVTQVSSVLLLFFNETYNESVPFIKKNGTNLCDNPIKSIIINHAECICSWIIEIKQQFGHDTWSDNYMSLEKNVKLNVIGIVYVKQLNIIINFQINDLSRLISRIDLLFFSNLRERLIGKVVKFTKEIYLFLRDLLKFSLAHGQCFINNDSARYAGAKRNILINIFNYMQISYILYW
jgi:hypothetical protein